jgi:hypothetical protein
MHNNRFQTNGALVDAGSHDPNKYTKSCTERKKLDIIRLKFFYKKKNKICFANNKHKINVRYTCPPTRFSFDKKNLGICGRGRSFLWESYYLQTFLSTNSYKICKNPPNEDLLHDTQPITLVVVTTTTRRGVCVTHCVALPFTLKSILMPKKNYENSNISSCKIYIYIYI